MNIKGGALALLLSIVALPLVAQEKLSSKEMVSNQLFNRSLQTVSSPVQSERLSHLWMAHLIDANQPAVLEALAPLLTFADTKWGFSILEDSFRRFGYDYQTGMALLRQSIYYKEWDRAEHTAVKLLELRPNDKTLVRTLISVYEESGQKDKALSAIQLIEGDARDVAVVYKEAQLLLELGKKSEAEKLLEEHLENHPGEPLSAIMLISLYAENNEIAKALDLLAEAQKLSPNDRQLSELSITINAINGNCDAVKREILRVATLEDSDPIVAQELLARARSRASDLNKMLPTLIETQHELQKIYPEVDQLVLAEANDHFLLSDTIQGEKLLQRLVDNGTQLPSPYYYFIERYAMAENTHGLKKVTDKGLKALPHEGIFHLYSALVDVNKGDTLAYNKKVAHAMEVVPEEDKLYGQLALMRAEVAMEKESDWGTAVKYFEIAIEKGVPMAYNNYAYALTSHGTPEDLNRAEEMARIAVQNDSENGSYLDTYAWILYLKQAYPLARIYMERAIEKEKESNHLYFEHYADILTALGEYDKALEALCKALESGGEAKVIEPMIQKVIKAKDAKE